jgi:hypothetical protein
VDKVRVRIKNHTFLTKRAEQGSATVLERKSKFGTFEQVVCEDDEFSHEGGESAREIDERDRGQSTNLDNEANGNGMAGWREGFGLSMRGPSIT